MNNAVSNVRKSTKWRRTGARRWLRPLSPLHTLLNTPSTTPGSALSMAWCLKVLAPCLKSGSFINFFMVAQTNYRIDSNTGVSATLCMLDGSFNCITKIWGFALFFSEQFCCPLWKSIPAQKKVHRHRTGCDKYELRLHLQRLFCLYLAHHRHVVVVVKNDKGLGVSSVCERGEDRLCISSVRGRRIRKWWRGSKHPRHPL